MAALAARIDKFNDLLEKARARQKALAGLQPLKGPFQTESEATTTMLKEATRAQSLLTAARIDPAGLDSATYDFFDFAQSLASGAESIAECKPPLSPGDLDFSSIAGLSDTKEIFRSNYINPFVYPALFPKPAKGVLLYGVPGTGKTLLARAASAEIPGLAFFAPSPGELRNMYEGGTEKAIKLVFDCADQYVRTTPGVEFAIIFFDEFDSIAGKRGEDRSMRISVNALLQAMDGISSSPRVSVIAATNYPSSIDDAVMRRFTQSIFVDLPDAEAIEYLIRDALAAAYNTPGLRPPAIPAEDSTAMIVQGDYLDNITRMGLQFNPRGGDENPVTDQYIMDLVNRFGPTTEGKNIIQKLRKNPSSVSDDDSKLDSPVHLFGYSPSDIRKIIELAVTYASTRAVMGLAELREIQRGDGGYWISTPYEVEGSRYITDLTSPDDRKRVVNFDIRRSDVERALKNYASTVDNHRYVEVLKHSLTA